jgi:hypothetical protein
MSEIAGILNAIGRNLEGVDKRRQEQNKVRNQLVREGFDVAPERVGQGTGNKILAGLFGGTSDPTTRATMSERHPYMQAIAKAQADKDQRAITNQLARDQYNATKSYNDEMLKIQQDNNDIRRQQLGLDLVKEWRGMVVAKTAERQGILDSINARASDLAKQDTPEALQKMMELVAQVETEITEVYNGSLYDWFTPDNWGRDEFQAAEFVGNNYSTDTAKHLRRLTAQRKTLLEALAKWDQNILAKSSRELGPMWSALFETMKNNDDFLFSGKIPAPKFGPDGKVEFDLNPMHFGGTRTGLTGDSGGFYSDLNKVANNQELEGDSLDNEASESSEEAELAEYHRSQAFRNTSLSGAVNTTPWQETGDKFTLGPRIWEKDKIPTYEESRQASALGNIEGAKGRFWSKMGEAFTPTEEGLGESRQLGLVPYGKDIVPQGSEVKLTPSGKKLINKSSTTSAFPVSALIRWQRSLSNE